MRPKSLLFAVLGLLVLMITTAFQNPTPTNPGPRDTHELIYHPDLDQVLLIHGDNPENTTLQESNLWAWDGEQWTLLEEEVGFPARLLGGTSYDIVRHRLAVFGGIHNLTQKRADLWEWDGETWLEIEVEGPEPRDHIMMVYDEAHSYSLFFSGVDDRGRLQHDTWTWDGEQWEQVATTGPEGRAHYSLIYDPLREQVLMFGGILENGELSNETWLWDGETWRLAEMGEEASPSPRDAPRLAFDANSGEVVLFGGRVGDQMLGDTWVWDGSSWQERHPDDAPSARAFHAMAYDPNRESVLLYGGMTEEETLGDFWEWDGQNWMRIPQ